MFHTHRSNFTAPDRGDFDHGQPARTGWWAACTLVDRSVRSTQLNRGRGAGPLIDVIDTPGDREDHMAGRGKLLLGSAFAVGAVAHLITEAREGRPLVRMAPEKFVRPGR